MTTLDRVELFRNAPDEARTMLTSRAQLRRFEPGQPLMRQGEPAEAMFVIISGRVRVERGTDTGAPVLLAELAANDVVGEIGVLDGGPRTATVTAIEPTETLQIHRALLAVVLVQHPELAAHLLRTISARLRSADDIIDSLARESRG